MTRLAPLLRTLLALIVVALAAGAFAQTVRVEQRTPYGVELRGIVPGDALGWEIDEVQVLLALGADAPVQLEIYSPGFDPDDYRAAETGRAELGDERYDGGSGTLVGSFVLERDGRVLAAGDYQLEPHRWVPFFQGELEAGAYLLRTRFRGNGKNAFVTRVVTPDPSAASLSFAAGISLFDVRSDGWTQHLELDLPVEALPARYALYDGDGAAELEARVELPDGTLRSFPVSEDRAWTVWQFDQPGVHRVSFRLPAGAGQRSNTIAFEELFPAPVTTEVVDEAGAPIPLEPTVGGYAARRVTLQLPPAWRLLRVGVDGGIHLGDGEAALGFDGGHVRYVLTPAPARLRIEAELVLPDGARPYPLELDVDGAPLRLGGDGSAELELPAGEVALRPQVPGAAVTGPARATLVPGELTEARFDLRPEAALRFEITPAEVVVGDRVRLVAVADTLFPGLLPGDLALVLPDGLRPLDTPRLVAPLAQGRSLRLELDAVATAPGRYDAQARLAPWGLVATAAVTVRAPAALQFDKTALTPAVAVGETARWRLTVTNHGGVAAEAVRVSDPLAPGLDGAPLDAVVTLAAGETRSFEVVATVTDGAPERIVNRARVRFGGELLEAEAAVRVRRPAPALERDLDRLAVVPGERVTVTLRVRNDGDAPLVYTLIDALPEWLEPEAPPVFEGALPAGGAAEHSYRARVRFGPAASAALTARLAWNGGSVVADGALERRLVGLDKSVDAARIVLGGATDFTVRVTNPLPRPLALTLRESPDAGLGLDAPAELALELAADETRTLRFAAQPERTGTLRNEVSVWFGSAPAALPAGADLLVLPPLVAQRRSQVVLPFEVDSAVAASAVLLRHALPAGASYVPGSSRLDGAPIADPLVVEEGAGNDATASAAGAGVRSLLWRLDSQPRGELRYELQHQDALGPLAEPDLTLGFDGIELPLQGNATFGELERAAPVDPAERDGLIREPLPQTVFRTVDQTRVVVEVPLDVPLQVQLNGVLLPEAQLGEVTLDRERGVQRLAWYGLPLQPGRNLIEVEAGAQRDRVEVWRAGNPVRLELRPLASAADGLRPIEIEIVALDENGVANGFGALTIATDLEPTRADAFPDESGYQLLLEDGRALLRLRPVPSPRRARVAAAFNRLELDETLFLGGSEQTLWQALGSATVQFGSEGVAVSGVARAYLETPLGDGALQAAFDSAGGLAPRPEPDPRFPLTGAGSDAEPALRSDDLVALRYDDERFSVGYWTDPVELPGVGDAGVGGEATALRGEARLDAGGGRLTIGAFAALVASDEVALELTPDGTRRYRLGAAVRPGSERVVLRIGAEERPLERLRDYVLNSADGVLTLAAPLWPTENGQRVALLVRFTPVEAVRDAVAFGVGASWELGAWRVAVGGASRGGSQLGAEVGYRAASPAGATAFGVRWRYSEGASRVGVDAAVERGPVAAALDLAYDGVDATLRGRARAAVEVAPGHTVAAEHRADPERNRSAVLYELDLGGVEVGVGLDYRWEEGGVGGLGRLGWSDDTFAVDLSHSQGFRADARSTSDLRVRARIDEGLRAEAGLAYLWGGELSGTVGLEQRLGDGNLALSYQLPGADGRGNRARFGVAAPLPLGGGVTVDLAADLEQGFSDGTTAAHASFAVRYERPGLTATLGSDAAWDARDDDPFRVVLRGGVSGQLDPQQTLSFDASAQLLPTLEGSFTVAYALRGRDLSLLTYHRLTTGATPTLEGEVAPTVHPDPSWQLRPGFAYRLHLDDASGDLYQLSLGATVHATDTIGVGGAVYHQWQPATGAGWTAFSLEGSARIVDELWLALGYTFQGYDGLTAETAGGIYLRLDAFGGSR